MEDTISRRSFLAGAGMLAAGAAAGGLTGCGQGSSGNPSGSSAEGTEETPTNWLGSEPVIADGDIAKTIETEVLVIGGGTSGLFAACSATENGAATLVIDKSSSTPGVRGTIGAIGSRAAIADNCAIDKFEIVKDMDRYALQHCDSRLHLLWADESGDTVNWYEERCSEQDVKLWHDSDADLDGVHTSYRHWATGHSPHFSGGTAAIGEALIQYATSKGAEFRWSTGMVKLTREGEKVTGVIAQDDEGYLRIKASKGVIVCTGGYASNQTMMDALQPDNTRIYTLNTAIPGTDGDGIRACIWAGGDFDDIHTCMLFDRGAIAPDKLSGETSDGGMFWMGSQPWLKVNMAGERFINESCPYDFVLHSMDTQPDHTYCTVWDSRYTDYVHQFKTQGCSRMFDFVNGAPPNAMSLDTVNGMIAGMIKSGIIQQADTIEELAGKLGLPTDPFTSTVSRYNELYRKGVDEDFGKETFRLSGLDTPPYFGVRQTGQLLCTLDGIRIDTNMNALDKDGKAISGLYVCGNDSGNYYAFSYPDVSAGNAAGRSATFGRRAGRIAATS